MYSLDKKIDEPISQLEALQKRKAAYALNLCLVSISQIIDYNDKYILQQEYDNILNNLNLQNFIKEEVLLDVLKKIIDTCNKCKIQECDKEFIEHEYQQKMKNAIWACVPNFSVILNGRTPMQIAIAATTQIGIGYMNYRKNKSEYILNKNKQLWQLQNWAIEQFHSLRYTFFEAAWRFADKFDYPDYLRLSEKKISNYNEILIDPNPLRRFERLDSISEYFLAFPPFWYHKGSTAREIALSNDYIDATREKFRHEALEAFQKFDELHVDFMREDVIAASCALERISLLSLETDTDEINNLLQKAIGFARGNYDILQMCVPIYLSLQQLDEVKKILKMLVNEQHNLSMNGFLLSRIYYKQNAKDDYELLKATIGEKYISLWTDDDTFPPDNLPEPPKQDDLGKMIKDAKKLILAATGVNGIIGAVPIPVADLPLMVAAQSGMMLGIAAVFKIDIKKDGLKTLALAALGVSGGAVLGKFIATSILKLIPGPGHIIGGTVSAATAILLTHAMGYAFIEICKAVKLEKLREEDITSKTGTDMFKKFFKDFLKKEEKEKKDKQDKK